MIKIGNTYIPNQPVMLEVKAITTNQDQSLNVILKHHHPETNGLTCQLHIIPTTDQEYAYFFDLLRFPGQNAKEITEIPIGGFQVLKEQQI